MSFRFSSACTLIELQGVDSDGQPLLFIVGIATYSITNEKNLKMFYIVLSNKYQSILKSSLVECILIEEEITTYLKIAPIQKRIYMTISIAFY